MSGPVGDLRAAVGEAVAAAAEVYAGTPQASTVADLAERLAGPLRVAIAGRVKAGKSTLLNALVGQELAATDARECTRVVTWYHHGLTYRVDLQLRDGTEVAARFGREAGGLDIDLDGRDADDLARIDVTWPTPALTELTLIDTPGIDSLTVGASERSLAFLAGDEEPTPADAVVYLLRHVHVSDVRFLEAFHDQDLAHAAPVHAVGVLSRADEIGAARVDALASAARIAARYSDDPRLRRLCQVVCPVAGLLAESAATLAEDEYRAVAALGALPREQRLALLATVDRFRAEEAPGDVPALTRTHLLDRLGLFGVRLGVGAVADGRVGSAQDLAAVLREASGIDGLWDLLRTRFADRADALKARSALLALRSLVERHPVPGADELARRLEAIEAAAHELAEIRLLNDLRLGAVDLGDDGPAAERLLGASGTSPADRLGPSPEVGDGVQDLRTSLVEAHTRWSHLAESPFADPATTDAARVLVRSCEGLLASTDIA